MSFCLPVVLDERDAAVLVRLERRPEDVAAGFESRSERCPGLRREVEPVRLHPGLDADVHRRLRLRAQEQQVALVPQDSLQQEQRDQVSH